MSEVRTYSVRVDGFELTTITLEFDQYKDQKSRDEVRRAIALTYKTPPHYMRLVQIKPRIVWVTDMKTGKQERVGIK